MDKLQYDSFYKFLVSLGMLLITLPVLAFLYVLNMDCKLISQSEIICPKFQFKEYKIMRIYLILQLQLCL